ncbi:hypothetical protein FRB90_008866, partial [Tulasnella sp. 427]
MVYNKVFPPTSKWFIISSIRSPASPQLLSAQPPLQHSPNHSYPLTIPMDSYYTLSSPYAATGASSRPAEVVIDIVDYE